MPKKTGKTNINLDLEEDQSLLSSLPEQYMIREYTRRRFNNLLTPNDADSIRTSLQGHYQSGMQVIGDPESPDYRRMALKAAALNNGWTPEDMAVMDALFDASLLPDPGIRTQAEGLMDIIQNAPITAVAERQAWLSALGAFCEITAAADIPVSENLRTAVTNASEREVLPTEYPADEDFLQNLADEDKFTIQYFSDKASDPVHVAASMLQNRMEDHRRKSDAQRRADADRDYYVMPKTSEAGDEYFSKNLVHVTYKMSKSNRQAAKEVFGDAVYDSIDEARKGSAEERKVPLHHSVGTKKAAAGSYVFEVDFAGTSFTQTHRDHHGLDGWYGKLAKEGGNDPKLRELLDMEYGPLVDGRTHVREKETEIKTESGQVITKKRLTLSGPNTTDTGEYSIADNTNYATEKLKGYITSAVNDYREKLKADPNAELPDIHILITGHSRGAVAAGETARELGHWANYLAGFGDLAKYIKITPILRDPVPGRPGYDAHAENNLSGIPGMNSTVFYSLSQEHYDYFFEPQLIRGADRIVFGVMPHSTALDGADLSQMAFADDAMAHKRGFYDASTGEFYRGSGLSELPKGLFFTDERQNLIRVDSWSQVDKLADAVYEDGKGRQPRRLNIVRKAAQDWFIRNDLEMSYPTEEHREQALENLNRTKNAILESKDNHLLMIKNGLRRLSEVENNPNASKKDKIEVLENLKKNCRFVMLTTGVGEPEDNAKLSMVGDLLTGVQKEKNYLERGLDQVRVNEQKELAGGAERQLNRDEARLNRIADVYKYFAQSAAEAKILLDRLDATTKSGANSEKYDTMHEALERVSRLSSASTINEAAKAYSDLQTASSKYYSSHKSNLFRGDSGIERKAVAHQAEDLGAKYSAALKEQSRGIPNKDSKIEDLLSRQGNIVDRSRKKVSSLQLKDLEKKVNPGAKENGPEKKTGAEKDRNDQPEIKPPVKEDILQAPRK